MNTYKRVLDILKKSNIEYIEVDQTAATSRSVDDLVKMTGMKYAEGMSTLFFKDENGRYIVILRRDDRNLRISEIKKRLGIKSLNFVEESDLASLGFEAGLVSPVVLGELNKEKNLIVLIDSKVLEMQSITCGIAKEGYALKIKGEDLLHLIGKYEVMDITDPNPKRQDVQLTRRRILTGDRPTGKLHIGHLFGSLLNRVKLQDEYEQFILIANIQALADNYDNPEKVRDSIEELLCYYYAVGIDFDKTTVYIQSEVPEVHEIFVYLSNFATVQQIAHNPTIKTELKQLKMEVFTPLGFYMYPIHQAADILLVNADLVPVGRDQAPMVEDTREIAKKFNKTYGVEVLNKPEALFGVEKNVPGTDGNAKMGKSLNNCIYLSDSEEELKKKIMRVYTDPTRIKATDPGHIEGNVAFAYMDLFNENTKEVEDMKNLYKKGKIGDVAVKERLFEVMNTKLKPIRERRKEAESMKKELLQKTLDGSIRVRAIARGIADQMKEAMKIKF